MTSMSAMIKLILIQLFCRGYSSVSSVLFFRTKQNLCAEIAVLRFWIPAELAGRFQLYLQTGESYKNLKGFFNIF